MIEPAGGPVLMIQLRVPECWLEWQGRRPARACGVDGDFQRAGFDLQRWQVTAFRKSRGTGSANHPAPPVRICQHSGQCRGAAVGWALDQPAFFDSRGPGTRRLTLGRSSPPKLRNTGRSSA